MSQIQINGVNINYTQQGKGRDVVCLHGWGQNIKMFQATQDFLKPSFKVTVLDFPGFGDSSLPPVAWGVEEYTLNFKIFCDRLDIHDPILIAHSFGARVAIQYAAQYKVHKLILTGAAGLKPRRGPDYYVKLAFYKTAKQVFKLKPLAPFRDKLATFFGSSDYKNTEGVLRQSFVKIVNEDLRRCLPFIKVPTLLVWGELDDATPLWMGKVMAKEMKDAGLVVFEKEGHFAYHNQSVRFHKIIDVFLEKDKTHE
ncbi:MAG: alpha/beta hydrolase fold protein [Erysipelotrichaceae bacterium]|nr:MAG: alpha/beta hydrolase fold [Erysipelotrichaceae bacterium]TXT18317.1 MAG: alpha/beta hydrolase fold protein [Erysipelotrichaceae bacterium]